MATLYELVGNKLNLLELSDSEDIPKEILDEAFSSIDGDINSKIENMVKFIKNIESNIIAKKTEEERLYKLRKSEEKKVENIKTYLFEQMNLLNKKKIDTGIFTLNIRKNAPSVEIERLELIPDEYFKIKKEPDKTLIKNCIKADVFVPGAKLVSKESLQIK